MMKLSAIVVLVALGVAAVQSQDQCNVCQSSSNILCESESTYYLCIGNQRYGPLYCDDDQVCSNTNAPCVARSEIADTVQNVCGGSGSCQTCSDDSQYTCVSSTQAARCISGVLSTSIIIDCGTDEICVSDAIETFSTPCVPQCVADFAKWNSTCSNAEYTTPTQSPPTTPSSNDQQTICQAAAANKNTKFFYAYADSTCRTYVYCQRASVTSTIFTTTFTGSCSSPTPYFNTASGVCQSSKSASCLAEAPTTTTSVTSSTSVTDAPTTATDAPSTATDAPTTATDAPSTATNAPSTATDAPSTATNAPSTATDAPSTATNAPSTATDAPAS